MAGNLRKKSRNGILLPENHILNSSIRNKMKEEKKLMPYNCTSKQGGNHRYSVPDSMINRLKITHQTDINVMNEMRGIMEK
jgi:hypothetical protein